MKIPLRLLTVFAAVAALTAACNPFGSPSSRERLLEDPRFAEFTYTTDGEIKVQERTDSFNVRMPILGATEGHVAAANFPEGRGLPSPDHHFWVTGVATVSPESIQKLSEGATGNATDGHFDLGPAIDNGTLVARVKDDRTQPAQWVDPSSLTFALGDAARITAPADLGFVATPGSSVWLIPSTQIAGVPWLGLNSQREEIVTGTSGPVQFTLDAVEGTDSVSVERAVVEVQLVDQAGTAAGLHSDAQAQVVATLLRQEALHLRSCDVGEDNLVGGSLSCGLGHGAPYDAEKTYALDTLLPPSHLAPGVGCALSVTRCARCAAQLPPV